LAAWSRILSDPFHQEGIFCPVSYNPAPSFIQSTARTTSTNLTFSVAANSSTQMFLFPGHYRPAGSATSNAGLDAVAYHALDLSIGASRFVVGPMDKTDAVATRPPIIGVINPNLTLNSCADVFGGGIGMFYDVPLPYVSVAISEAGSHSRWQMVAMGLKIRQTTPELKRGGSIVTVQPNTNYVIPTGTVQSQLEVFPTFTDHGPDGCYVSWIPRSQDMAFWHGTSETGASGASAVCGGAGIIAYLNNPTVDDLSYSFEVVCHWQLAGSYLNTVGRPGAHSPDVKPAVEKAISYLQNAGHSGAAAFGKIASAAVDHSGSKSAGSWLGTAIQGVKMAARVASLFGP
jgi:hypothetical protein